MIVIHHVFDRIAPYIVVAYLEGCVCGIYELEERPVTCV